MTLNFAELTQKIRSGGKINEQDTLDMLCAGPGATFALVEFAAEFRRKDFRNRIDIVNLPGKNDDYSLSPAEKSLPEKSLEKKSSAEKIINLRFDANQEPQALSNEIYSAVQSHDIGQIVVDFIEPSGAEEIQEKISAPPMHYLRILATLRIATPESSLCLRQGRVLFLRSLQSLSLHLVDAIYLSDYRAESAQQVFEDLKIIFGAGLEVIGAGQQDVVDTYIAAMSEEGITEAVRYAQEILGDGETASDQGGCGGNCGCGSGGCG